MMKKIMRTVVSLLMAVTSMALIAGCGKENKEPPHEHAWGAGVIVTNATCTEKGSKKFTCECGVEKTEDIAALGHDLEQVAGKDATCTNHGWKAYEKCNRWNCTHTTYKEIDAKGHTYVNGICTVEGCDSRTTAGHTKHTWNEGEITTQPTCTEKGVKTYTCWCEDFYTESIDELGHTFTTEITTQPTCTTNGIKTHTCHCGVSGTETIELLGHNYEEGVCSHCGKDTIIITYYIVYGKKVVPLDTYPMMKDSEGYYPTSVTPNSTVTISALKAKGMYNEYVEVTNNMGLKFLGWYLDEACTDSQSLGKTAELTVTDDIAVYAYCDEDLWIGPY